MIEGGEDLTRQFNRGIDYIQNSFNTSEGVLNRQVPTLLYRAIVIEIDFTAIKPTTTAAIEPPFSIYAKIIGLDEDSANPQLESDRVYYPPLFPMHNLCVPEVGEEILILKEAAEVSAKGYYIGRVNDSSPLNVSYARDFVGINDSETNNTFRYGFSFDVRGLRTKVLAESPNSMPSDQYNNVSIPITYGDVVQQGRSKTYVRQSFNKNNKKGVLEQGLLLSGQQISEHNTHDFRYDGHGVNVAGKVNPISTEVKISPETGEVYEYTKVTNENYILPENRVMKESFDPSIGETSTKTIHFIDSSIRRLGEYTLQSAIGGAGQNNIEGPDKGMIVNIADEIYNISSREISGGLYRQVLGERLVSQQRETYELMKEVLTIVKGLAHTTHTLLTAFLDHEHALPRIDLDLEKEFTFHDLYKEPAVWEPTAPQIITIPGVPAMDVFGNDVRIEMTSAAIQAAQDGDPHAMSYLPDMNNDGQRNFDDFFMAADLAGDIKIGQTIPTRATSVEIQQPPTLVSPGAYNLRVDKKTLNFEAIIGGAENPRFTAQIATASGEEGVPDPEIGVKTEKINTDLNDTLAKVINQQATIERLSTTLSNFLSKNQFIN